MRKEHLSTLVSLTAAMFVAVVTIPYTTEALFRGTDQNGNLFSEDVPDVMEAAKSDKLVQSRKRHSFYKAMEIYRDLLKAGEENLLKPDINDSETVEYYLERVLAEERSSSSKSPAHAAAVDVEKELQELTREQRALLRQLEHSRNCPESLRGFTSGFYELCMALISGKSPVRVRAGFTNDLIHIRTQRGVLTNTLENRLKMIRQAKEGTKRTSTQPSTLKTAAPTK